MQKKEDAKFMMNIKREIEDVIGFKQTKGAQNHLLFTWSCTLNIDINMLKTSCLKGSAHYGI
jgi:hypothetical protein